MLMVAPERETPGHDGQRLGAADEQRVAQA